MIKEIKFDQGKILLDIETEFENHRFESFFSKEPETITWLQTFIKPGEILFDVGANIGVFSLYPAALFGDRVKIYSFEPAYHNYYKLCKNIIVNKFSNIIFPYQIALGAKSYFTDIDLISLVEGSANHLLSDIAPELKTPGQVVFHQGIFCASLDDLSEKYSFSAPQHIKIDVDGFELQVLKGAANMLSGKNVKSVLVEVSNFSDNNQQVRTLMKNLGYSDQDKINFSENHSRTRRMLSGNKVDNIIFTKPL